MKTFIINIAAALSVAVHAHAIDLDALTNQAAEAVDHYERPTLDKQSAARTALETLTSMETLYKAADMDALHELSYVLEEAVKLLPLESVQLEKAIALAEAIHLGSEGEGHEEDIAKNIGLLTALVQSI